MRGDTQDSEIIIKPGSSLSSQGEITWYLSADIGGAFCSLIKYGDCVFGLLEESLSPLSFPNLYTT